MVEHMNKKKESKGNDEDKTMEYPLNSRVRNDPTMKTNALIKQ